MQIDDRLLKINQHVANGLTFGRSCKKVGIGRTYAYKLVRDALTVNKMRTNTQLIAESLRQKLIA